MRIQMHSAAAGIGLLLASTVPAFGQAGPPAPASLEDVSGCTLDGENVFIVTGRDASARRYKYPWDASIDALCNAKGFAIASPAKGAMPPAPPAARAAPLPAAPVTAAAASPAPATTTPSVGGVLTEFPPGAMALSAEALRQRVSGQTFNTQFRDGTRVRIEYKTNGYVYANAPGYNNSGPWRVEESRICGQLRNSAASCNEIREQGQQLYLKRDNGDVIALNPQ